MGSAGDKTRRGRGALVTNPIPQLTCLCHLVSIKMNVIPRRWLWEGNGESRDLMCCKTEATSPFKDSEIMLNLVLSLDYHDFESSELMQPFFYYSSISLISFMNFKDAVSICLVNSFLLLKSGSSTIVWSRIDKLL